MWGFLIFLKVFKDIEVKDYTVKLVENVDFVIWSVIRTRGTI
jgi:hypothetical protein